MYRRSFVSTLALASLAGCATDGGEDDETQPGADDRPDESGDADATDDAPASTASDPLAAFEAFLEGNGVAINRLETVDTVVELEYVPWGQTDEELATEIGLISGGFFRGVEEGIRAERLSATMRSSEDEPLATWHADVEWLTAFRDGDLTEDELSLRVLESLELAESSR